MVSIMRCIDHRGALNPRFPCLQVVPSTAIGFTVYEHLKHYLDVVGNL